MIIAKLKLCILSFDKSDLEYKILSLNSMDLDLPEEEITTDSKLDDLCKKIFNRHINTSSDYFNFRLVDIEVKAELNIIYYVMIPYQTDIKNSYLLSLKQHANNSFVLRKILSLI